MEYITTKKFRFCQEGLASKLKRFGVKFRMLGLIHTPGNHILNQLTYSMAELKEKLAVLDNIIVFGSSLKRFIASLDINKKIIQTFHYVDTDYYIPQKKNLPINRLRLVCVGYLMRDFNSLLEIIKSCPESHFDLCMGRFDFTNQFSQYPNVTLHKLLTEKELKKIMQLADVSLNVMEDTVGSNVITTSMACGLAIIVSDVGSIRDYCDNSNAIFCKTIDDFIHAVHVCSDDASKVKQMSYFSHQKALNLSLNEFEKSFNNWIFN